MDDDVAAVSCHLMWYQITANSHYLKAELFDRQTAAETREFLDAVVAECSKQRRYHVLISVCSSRPLFSVEKYGLSTFAEFARAHSARVALLADSAEVRTAHEYAVMLARLRGVDVRTFRNEATAVKWLAGDARH